MHGWNLSATCQVLWFDCTLARSPSLHQSRCTVLSWRHTRQRNGPLFSRVDDRKWSWSLPAGHARHRGSHATLACRPHRHYRALHHFHLYCRGPPLHRGTYIRPSHPPHRHTLQLHLLSLVFWEPHSIFKQIRPRVKPSRSPGKPHQNGVDHGLNDTRWQWHLSMVRRRTSCIYTSTARARRFSLPVYTQALIMNSMWLHTIVRDVVRGAPLRGPSRNLPRPSHLPQLMHQRSRRSPHVMRFWCR